MRNYFKFLGLTIIVCALSAQAQTVTISALTSFGTSGWLTPGSSGLGASGSSANRGLAFADGELFYTTAASSGSITEINPTSGASIGNLTTSGISGGTFNVDSLAAGGDGTLYVGNLTTSGSTAFSVYAFANPTSLSTSATRIYSANPTGGSTRLGDSLAAIGSGTSTYIAAGSGAGGSSGYTIINQGVATAVGVSGAPTPGFDKAITFVNSSQVIGLHTAGTYYNTTFSGSVGTLSGSVSIPDSNGNGADRILSYNVLDGQTLLAVQSTGDSHVSLYDMTTPNSPVFLGSLDNAVSPGSNANGTGQIAWGAVTVNPDGSESQTLYALSSGQGIQAFVVVVPEPATLSLVALGGLAVVAFRKKLRQ